MVLLRFFARPSRNCLRTHVVASPPCPFFQSFTRAFHLTPQHHATEMETVNTTERLSQLRALMKDHKLDIYSTRPLTWSPLPHSDQHPVVPSEDSHQSEYIAPCDARRGQLSPRPRITAQKLIEYRVHQRFLGISWNSGSDLGEGLTRNRRSILQPGGETTR
jgi:hypothetical protein